MTHLEAFTAMGWKAMPLSDDRVNIGRNSECQVSINDDRAFSRLHAMIEQLDAGWCLRDLQSRNGTFGNSERVKSVVAVRTGHEIQVWAWRFHYFDESDDTEATLQTGEPPSEIRQPGRASHLSDREKDLLRLLAQGSTDEDIGRELFVAVSTVRSHLDQIRDKKGCRRRPELTRLAVEEGIVPPGRPRGASSYFDLK